MMKRMFLIVLIVFFTFTVTLLCFDALDYKVANYPQDGVYQIDLYEVNKEGDVYNPQVDVLDEHTSDFGTGARESTISLLMISFMLLTLGIIFNLMSYTKEIVFKLVTGYSHSDLFYSLFKKELVISYIISFLLNCFYVYYRYGYVDEFIIFTLVISMICSFIVVYLMLLIYYVIKAYGNVLDIVNSKRLEYVLQVNAFIFKLILTISTFLIIITVNSRIDEFELKSKYKDYLEYTQNMYVTEVSSKYKDPLDVKKKSINYYNQVRANKEVESLMMEMQVISDKYLSQDINAAKYYILTNSNYLDYVEILSDEDIRINKNDFDSSKATFLVPDGYDIEQLKSNIDFESNVIRYKLGQKTPFFALEDYYAYVDFEMVNMPIVVLPDVVESIDTLVADPISSGNFLLRGDETMIKDIMVETKVNENFKLVNVYDRYKTQYEKAYDSIILIIVFSIIFLILSFLMSIVIVISEIKIKSQRIALKMISGFPVMKIYKSLILKFMVIIPLGLFHLFDISFYYLNDRVIYLIICYLFLCLIVDIIIIYVINNFYIDKNIASISKESYE